MTNVFHVNILGRRKKGDIEQARLQLFHTDGTPLNLRDLDTDPVKGGSLLDVWKGVYDRTLDYEAGSLVRHNGSTYLAVSDAVVGQPDPGDPPQFEIEDIPGYNG